MSVMLALMLEDSVRSDVLLEAGAVIAVASCGDT
eukprot:CAMPEP_0183704592 /NCGR_PEP_ID=MMETSP0737-20130205/1880_1 /TAXON_ID=385413 /ORGANISM="Thalassiosira miniscula, Strain CCMP1093" /LENGTH=33 /DNA_ID= /DNA_START= /DNA_END= /DNA_ORIENTATION=